MKTKKLKTLDELVHKKVMEEAQKQDFEHTSEAKSFLISRGKYWREKLKEAKYEKTV